MPLDLRGSHGRAAQGVLLRDALDGGRRSVSSRLLSRHPAGVFGSTRVRVSVLRRGVSAAALRQPEECGEEGFARGSAGGERAGPLLPVALGALSWGFAIGAR